MKKRAVVLVFLFLLSVWTLQAQRARPLDTTRFVVLGEGLAAGMTNLGLNAPFQERSFPAQMALQMKTAFPQPLFQSPGLGALLGKTAPPVALPTYPQTRVRLFPPQENTADERPTLFIFNLSVPNFKLVDSLSRRPVPPLIQSDPQQTLINLILGFPSLILDRDVPLWTQLEYARAMVPTFALVELGYYDVLAAAASGDPDRIPSPAAFQSSYTLIVQSLRNLHAEVLVTTIPDPLDTAYFLSPKDAAAQLHLSPAEIVSTYGLAPGDLLTRDSLTTIGLQFILSQPGPLPPGSVLEAAVAEEITARVNSLNAVIQNVARDNGAIIYDLHGMFRRVRTQGFQVGIRFINSQPFGGFYSLDGVYPGGTGHALIANEILGLLNRNYQQSFPLVDVDSVAQQDPVVQYLPAQ